MSLNPESRAALERLQTKWAREQEGRRKVEPEPTTWQKALSYLKSYWELVRG